MNEIFERISNIAPTTRDRSKKLDLSMPFGSLVAPATSNSVRSFHPSEYTTSA